MGNWLIIGATSGIAQPLSGEMAARGHRLFLADRESLLSECERIAQDLRIRHNVEVLAGRFDALSFEDHATFVDNVESAFGKLDGVIWLVGVMHPQPDLMHSSQRAVQQHTINFTAAMSVLSEIANRMESRHSGTIVAFGSPAGDRIRLSNYHYGVDKMALHGYLEGLRMRLSDSGVSVITVKPGPTATPMTANIEAKSPLADPNQVAQIIAAGIAKNQSIIYAPSFWKYIMFVFRIMPTWLLRKLNV